MNETNNASAMFAPIWRRKWLIVGVAVLVAIGSYFYYKHERPSYLATTQIYLGAGAEEQVPGNRTVVGSAKKGGSLEPAAQAVLINSAIIKAPVRLQLHKMRKTRAVKTALTGKVKAKAAEKSEFVTVTTEVHSARGAALLANLTAETYVKRENAKYTRGVEAAIALARRQLHRVEANEEAPAAKSGSKGGGSARKSASVTLQVTNLSAKINQLETELGIVNVKQVNPVKIAAVQEISASPKRNAIFGFAIGLLLASLVAYALAGLDHRLRTLTDIEGAFGGAEILAALRAVRTPIVRGDGSPRPSNVLREPLQRLHTNLQVGSVNASSNGHGAAAKPRTIMFVSADAGDGQTTVVADLALIQADAGERVAIVEADLRRPALAGMLGLDDKPGLADVLESRLSIGEAIQSVGRPAPAQTEESSGAQGAVLAARATGSAAVLVGDAGVANPPALLAGPTMAELIRELGESHDYVLIDAPGPLEVSDGIPLLGLVDGIIIVARAGQTRDISARRLTELLARTPSAPVLGVVANGVSQRDVSRYGFSAYNPRRWRRGPFRR
jgi:Mrp family chromosome partitioning ATPase/capsular polysaccharide biosynthesis protein